MKAALFLLLALVSTTLSAQENVASKPDRRYLNPIFDEVTFTPDIEFAVKHNNFGNKTEHLKLRVFEPKGDTLKKRPLFLLMPGGGWVVNGDDWMNDVAEEIAKTGFVVAIHKYRLSESINTPTLYFDALAKASADQRDALNYLINDAKSANRFGIDPTKIFIGGHSAGAITSMHTAYFDQQDAVQQGLKEAFATYKTLPNKADRIPLKGVINLSGLLSDLDIIDHNDIPLLSIHGDKDHVVPAGRSEGRYGSIAIDEWAAIVNTKSQLHIIEDGLHNDPAIPALCEECVPLIKRFMFNHLND